MPFNYSDSSLIACKLSKLTKHKPSKPKGFEFFFPFEHWHTVVLPSVETASTSLSPVHTFPINLMTWNRLTHKQELEKQRLNHGHQKWLWVCECGKSGKIHKHVAFTLCLKCWTVEPCSARACYLKEDKYFAPFPLVKNSAFFQGTPSFLKSLIWT